MTNIARVCGWFGAAGLSAAPFFITTRAGLALAIFSLMCLSVQSVHKALLNLTILNMLGVLGYTYAFLHMQ